MKISIITVSFNSRETIVDAMLSVLRQQHEEFDVEHIIVDGGSTDGTVEVIKDFELTHNTELSTCNYTFKWMSEKDNGLYDAMNKGIQIATGEIVGIVNSDDMLNSDHVLKDVISVCEPDVAVIYSDVRIVPRKATLAQLSNTPSIRYIWPQLWRPWMLSWGWTPPHPGLFIRKAAYLQYGAYLTGYEISSDDEIVVRLVRSHGVKCKYMPTCASAMRTGGKSQSGGIRTFIKQNKEFVEMNRANGYFCVFPMMLPKLAIKTLEVVVPRVMNALGCQV